MSPHARWAPLFIVLVTACDQEPPTGTTFLLGKVLASMPAALGIDHEPVAPEATDTAQRTTPSILGFGLLDAVPDTEILAHADPDDRDGDGISGRPNRTADGRIGRFGRKAQVPTLREFVAQAFVMEMGITNPALPTEQTVGGAPLPARVDPTPDPDLTHEQLDAAVTL